MREVVIWAVVGVMMLVIVIALGSGLFSIVRGKTGSGQTVKSLTLRIGVSLALFFLLWLLYALGWIHPHGIYTT